jgi:hypothetical protein
MELAEVCEGCGPLWQRTATGFQLIFVVWLVREPGGIALKQREPRHGDPCYRFKYVIADSVRELIHAHA